MEVTPSCFFGVVVVEGLAVSRGEKRASKTKRGCLQAKQAGNASLSGLSPSHCSLAILPAHTRLNLTAPLSHSSPLVIYPSSPSFCLSLLIYCLFFYSFDRVPNSFLVASSYMFRFMHLLLLTLQGTQRQGQPLLFADCNESFAEAFKVKSWYDRT